MELLPEDVLADVLARLPPRALAVSRSVCRVWRAAVDVRCGHQLRAAAGLLPVTLGGFFVRTNEPGTPAFFARIAGDLDYYLAMDPRGGYGYYVIPDILDCCNGLLLLDEVDHIVNPATKQWLRLPPFPASPEQGADAGGFHYNKFLAFDPTLSPNFTMQILVTSKYRHIACPFHHHTDTPTHSTHHRSGSLPTPACNPRGKPAGRRRVVRGDHEGELRARGGGGAAAAGVGGGGRERAGPGARRDDLRRLRGGRRQQQPAGHAGARRLPALRPRLPGNARAHRPLLQRQARHRLHRGELGAELVPAGVPERGGAEQQQEPSPRRQLRVRRRRVPGRHGGDVRRRLAEPAGGVLPGVPVAGGGVGRRAAGQGADGGVHLRGERRHQRLRAELLREPGAGRRLHARTVRRRAHAAIHHLRRGPVQPGRPSHRRDVAAAHGVPPGVCHPLRRRRRRLRGAAQQRLPDLQPEAGRGRGRREAAPPGPQARRLRHLPAAPRPRQQPHQRRVLRVAAGVLRDGHDRDVGAVPPGCAGDVHQRHGLRLLGRLPPHGRRQPGARRRAPAPGPAAHRVRKQRSDSRHATPRRPPFLAGSSY